MNTLDKYIAPVKKRAEKATPGPWFIEEGVIQSETIVGNEDDIYDLLCAPDSDLGAHEIEANLTFAAHARTDVDRLVAMVELYDAQFQSLLNKVNRVTAPWRHQLELPSNADMNALANRQVEVEQTLRAELDRLAGEGGT